MSPTHRSLQLLRALGYEAAVVEKFNHHVGPHGIRQDLFGVADIEALASDHTLYVQATPADRLADHVAKCLEAPKLPALLACPTRAFEIWSWGRRKVNGRPRWRVRRLRAHLDGERAVFVELAAPAVFQGTPMEGLAP